MAALALKLLSFALGLATVAALAAAPPHTVEIAPGVFQPVISLGTCCGSKPSVGLGPWLEAGGTGIDTAYDYHDQSTIAGVLATKHINRSSLFITSKVPAGFGKPEDCSGGALRSLETVKQDLAQLKTPYLDLVLLHKPCKTAAENNALWKGLEMAKAQGLVRAIGVSNYKISDLEALNGTVPAVNQCLMSVSLHDTKTIDYCNAHKITYEAYEAMRTCPFANPKARAIAINHNATVSQVCLRWIYQHGCIMAVGTGSNKANALPYAKENLGFFAFSLTASEMSSLDKM